MQLSFSEAPGFPQAHLPEAAAMVAVVEVIALAVITFAAASVVFALTALAEASLLAGDAEKALSGVTEALQQTEKYQERGEEAYARWLRATIRELFRSVL